MNQVKMQQANLFINGAEGLVGADAHDGACAVYEEGKLVTPLVANTDSYSSF